MTTTEKAAEEFLLLHALKVKGMALPEAIAEASGLPLDQVRAGLEAAVAAEHAKERSGGRVSGFMLGSAGRVRYNELRASSVTDQEVAALVPAYEAFLAPNRAFKEVTTFAQTEANGDHASVVARLEPIHESLGRVLDLAAPAVTRMAAYRPRFEQAMAAIRSGDLSALAKPMSGSYHDVWMELHEDLILTLGRERNDADE